MGAFGRYDLKWYCIPEKACNFIFSTKTPSKNKTFAKKQQIKRQASFFHCDIMLKLSEFGQASCVIPYYSNNKELHSNKWLSISGQIYLSIFWEIGTKWERL